MSTTQTPCKLSPRVARGAVTNCITAPQRIELPCLLSRRWLFSMLSLALLLISLVSSSYAQLGTIQQGGGGFLVFGRVSLPDGNPAPPRVKVFIEALNGLRRDTLHACVDAWRISPGVGV